MSTEKPGPVCPSCGGDAVPIGYGFPGPGMFEAAERGELELGGCCIFEGQPTHRCRSCGDGFEACP